MTTPQTAHQYAIMLMAGGTPTPTDNARNVLILRAVKGTEDYAYALDLILARRRDWRTWMTLTQRKWQGNTRRPSRARHHDSISIREKYVRCSA